MASKVRVTKGFRRIRAALPDAIRAELVQVLEKGGQQLQTAMRARTPRLSGKLYFEGIKYRVFPKTLRLRVGLIGVPNGRAKLFYGRIQDLGRKAQTVTVTRGRARGKAYQMRVRAMAPKRFVTGRYPDLRRVIGEGLRGIWDRSLRSIAGSGNE